jgi:TorA maturation chaperone TorD
MNIEELLDREATRSNAYIGLAECYKLPENELSLSLKELAHVFKTLDPDSPYQSILKCIENQMQLDAQALQVDYARLFVGPYSLLAPPYGSVYLEGKRKIMESSTMDIKRRYGEAGLKMSDSFKEIPDHIRAELEFMHFLVFKEMEAMSQGDLTGFTNSLYNQQSFLEKHLRAWISDFADNVAKYAQTPFYQNLAIATEAFVKDDYHTVSTMLSTCQPVVETAADLESLQAQ